MSASDHEALRHALGGTLPQGIEALDAEKTERLTLALRDARKRQQVQIEAALQSALSHLPALLRGPVRKLFDA